MDESEAIVEKYLAQLGLGFLFTSRTATATSHPSGATASRTSDEDPAAAV
jgi:hypothetical protein